MFSPPVGPTKSNRTQYPAKPQNAALAAPSEKRAQRRRIALSQVDQNLRDSGQHWWTSSQSWSISVQCWSKCADSMPKLTTFGPTLVEFGSSLANSGPLLVNVGSSLVNHGPLLLNVGQLGAKLGRYRITRLAKHNSKMASVGREAGVLAQRNAGHGLLTCARAEIRSRAAVRTPPPHI